MKILHNNTFYIKTVQNEFTFRYTHPSKVQKTSLINQITLNEQQGIRLKTQKAYRKIISIKYLQITQTHRKYEYEAPSAFRTCT